VNDGEYTMIAPLFFQWSVELFGQTGGMVFSIVVLLIGAYVGLYVLSILSMLLFGGMMRP
jgi:hypothetical protein